MSDRPNDPWIYSSETGYLTEDGKIRIYGFPQQPDAKMSNARCASRQPIKLTLQPGQYKWCSCGYSTKQPMCDHAHCLPTFNTTRPPYAFEVLEETEVFLCRCKHTGNPPFCDGTHQRLNKSGELEEKVEPAAEID